MQEEVSWGCPDLIDTLKGGTVAAEKAPAKDTAVAKKEAPVKKEAAARL